MHDEEPAGRTHRRRSRGGASRADDAASRRLPRRDDYRPTQLTAEDASRAREVATPSARDLAEAAADLVIVRRHYTPPAT